MTRRPSLIAFLAICLMSGPLTAAPERSGEMQFIPSGRFVPLYRSAERDDSRQIESFWLDAFPVTNRQFLEFVTANPKWRRSNAPRLFADDNYLKHWAGDLDLGPRSELLAELPVVNVSWYAARAYAKWRGKRLPKQSEWEYAALASERSPDGRDEIGHAQRILDWYSRPSQGFSKWKPASFRNVYGVYDMHGLVWEWVDDFNTRLSAGESRSDSSLDRKLFCGSAAVGASDFKDYAAFMRHAFRSSLNAAYTGQNLGFRCASDADPTQSQP